MISNVLLTTTIIILTIRRLVDTTVHFLHQVEQDTDIKPTILDDGVRREYQEKVSRYKGAK